MKTIIRTICISAACVATFMGGVPAQAAAGPQPAQLVARAPDPLCDLFPDLWWCH